MFAGDERDHGTRHARLTIVESTGSADRTGTRRAIAIPWAIALLPVPGSPASTISTGQT